VSSEAVGRTVHWAKADIAVLCYFNLNLLIDSVCETPNPGT
jgi:hypothetical protein